jgi:hypothetical protein
MQSPVALSLWLGAALYAAIGLFGVIMLHDADPSAQDAMSGYGITITSASIASQSGK